MAIPTKNQTAKTTADVLYHDCIIRYISDGIPVRLHADQGAIFESCLIKNYVPSWE